MRVWEEITSVVWSFFYPTTRGGTGPIASFRWPERRRPIRGSIAFSKVRFRIVEPRVREAGGGPGRV
jgi:hypothetical protein